MSKSLSMTKNEKASRRRRLKKTETRIETNFKKAWYENGLLLLEIQQTKDYKIDYSNFREYAKNRFGFEEKHVYRLIDASKMYQILEKNSVDLLSKNEEFGQYLLPKNEAQIRPLLSLNNDSERVHVWNHLVESENKPTMAKVTEAVKEFQAHPIDVEIIEVVKTELVKENVHVSNNSGENEWYTPPQFIESARRTMGSIDLDPASCETANVNVKADTFFTMETNGLEQKWEGNIWMNPPYDKTIKDFSKKAVEERDNYSQLIVLVNNATETVWFTSFVEIASAICFIKSRVKFIDKNGDAIGAPLQGQAVIYIGANINRFREEFKDHGFICTLQ